MLVTYLTYFLCRLKKKSFMSVINQTEGGLKTKHTLVTDSPEDNTANS